MIDPVAALSLIEPTFNPDCLIANITPYSTISHSVPVHVYALLVLI